MCQSFFQQHQSGKLHPWQKEKVALHSLHFSFGFVVSLAQAKKKETTFHFVFGCLSGSGRFVSVFFKIVPISVDSLAEEHSNTFTGWPNECNVHRTVQHQTLTKHTRSHARTHKCVVGSSFTNRTVCAMVLQTSVRKEHPEMQAKTC